MSRHHEKPTRRTNPSGKTVWIARYTTRDGNRRSAGTYALRGACRDEQHDSDGTVTCCAQHAIDAAYERDQPQARSAMTVREYAATWLRHHPRTLRTANGYENALRAVIDCTLDGTVFGDMPLGDVRRRHGLAMVGVLLEDQGRAAKGAKGILAVVRAMFSDALDDERMDHNPFMGIKVLSRDPRIRKPARKVPVWTWEQMHAFARAAGDARTPRRVVYFTGKGRSERVEATRPHEIDPWRPVYAEPMIRVLSDCGLRLGELLALERRDLKGAGACDELEPVPCSCEVPHLHVRRRAWGSLVIDGTKSDAGHYAEDSGRVTVVPDGLFGLLSMLPARIDTPLLFPSLGGKVWQASPFYNLVWHPAVRATGMRANPHSFRHSYVSLLRAAGVDAFDLAARTGHTEATASGTYTHALHRSDDVIRRLAGGIVV